MWCAVCARPDSAFDRLACNCADPVWTSESPSTAMIPPTDHRSAHYTPGGEVLLRDGRRLLITEIESGPAFNIVHATGPDGQRYRLPAAKALAPVVVRADIASTKSAMFQYGGGPDFSGVVDAIMRGNFERLERGIIG